MSFPAMLAAQCAGALVALHSCYSVSPPLRLSSSCRASTNLLSFTRFTILCCDACSSTH